jgi:hypothetical protein
MISLLIPHLPHPATLICPSSYMRNWSWPIDNKGINIVLKFLELSLHIYHIIGQLSIQS